MFLKPSSRVKCIRLGTNVLRTNARPDNGELMSAYLLPCECLCLERISLELVIRSSNILDSRQTVAK